MVNIHFSNTDPGIVLLRAFTNNIFEALSNLHHLVTEFPGENMSFVCILPP